ncbi:MAG: GTP-binding protein, partial [Pseudomonadota bacterium]
VSVGKSSLLNALLGRDQFSTSPLHGETKSVQTGVWSSFEASGVILLDTPGIDEIGGEEREDLANRAARRSDLVIFVTEGDLTRVEKQAIDLVASHGRPLVIAMNKSDKFTADELVQLKARTVDACSDVVDPKNVVQVQARPDGRPGLGVKDLKQRLWEILAADGKTLAALNASMFASDLDNQISETILSTRQDIATKVIRSYCIGKGVAVALNPVPVADLLAAAAADATMVVHLSRVYNLPLTRHEAAGLITTVISQLAALMGTVWAVHMLSSALKLTTAGLSTVLTAGVQGAVAYYSTYVIGLAVQAYLARGKSWGESGPKRVIEDILDNLDRDSILNQAREDIRARLKK